MTGVREEDVEAPKKEPSMRTLDCPCGLTLTAADDEALYTLGRQHADEHHADQNIPDEFIRAIVRDNAKDADVA